MLGLPMSAMAQQQEVTGTVLDANRQPLIGVTVKVPGTPRATVTDMDGNYSISVNRGEKLEFTYIGFKPLTATVNKGRIDVNMMEDANLLDEVIATGYGSVSRKNLTTSIAKVDADKVVKTGTTNMSQMLMGRPWPVHSLVAA